MNIESRIIVLMLMFASYCFGRAHGYWRSMKIIEELDCDCDDYETIEDPTLFYGFADGDDWPIDSDATE